MASHEDVVTMLSDPTPTDPENPEGPTSPFLGKITITDAKEDWNKYLAVEFTRTFPADNPGGDSQRTVSGVRVLGFKFKGEGKSWRQVDPVNVEFFLLQGSEQKLWYSIHVKDLDVSEAVSNGFSLRVNFLFWRSTTTEPGELTWEGTGLNRPQPSDPGITPEVHPDYQPAHDSVTGRTDAESNAYRSLVIFRGTRSAQVQRDEFVAACVRLVHAALTNPDPQSNADLYKIYTLYTQTRYDGLNTVTTKVWETVSDFFRVADWAAIATGRLPPGVTLKSLASLYDILMVLMTGQVRRIPVENAIFHFLQTDAHDEVVDISSRRHYRQILNLVWEQWGGDEDFTAPFSGTPPYPVRNENVKPTQALTGLNTIWSVFALVMLKGNTQEGVTSWLRNVITGTTVYLVGFLSETWAEMAAAASNGDPELLIKAVRSLQSKFDQQSQLSPHDMSFLIQKDFITRKERLAQLDALKHGDPPPPGSVLSEEIEQFRNLGGVKGGVYPAATQAVGIPGMNGSQGPTAPTQDVGPGVGGGAGASGPPLPGGSSGLHDQLGSGGGGLGAFGQPGLTTRNIFTNADAIRQFGQLDPQQLAMLLNPQASSLHHKRNSLEEAVDNIVAHQGHVAKDTELGALPPYWRLTDPTVTGSMRELHEFYRKREQAIEAKVDGPLADKHNKRFKKMAEIYEKFPEWGRFEAQRKLDSERRVKFADPDKRHPFREQELEVIPPCKMVKDLVNFR